VRNLPYYATIAGSLSIAVGLVVVSYGHIRKFAIEAGAAEWEAAVIAVTVDSLVVLSIAAIGHARAVGHHPPAMAKAALLVGVVATTGANLHHGWEHGWMGIVVSLWVPVAAELAYQLAMSAVRIGPDGGHGQRDRSPAICGGRVIPVATVMAPVTAVRLAAEAAVATEAAALAARPAICGQTIPVAALVASLPVPAPDTRPAICTAVTTVATLRTRLSAVEVEVERPAICGGGLIPAATLAGHLAVEVVAEDRPVICGQVVSVAEVLARTAVTADPVAEEHADEHDDRPAPRPATVATTTGPREDTVLDWATEPGAPDTRMATATGADIVTLLAERGHGEVSERTARRVLATVRAAMADGQLVAA